MTRAKISLRVTRAIIRIMSKRKQRPNQPNQETSDDPNQTKKTTAAQVTRAKISLRVTETIMLKFRPRFKFRIRLTFMLSFR